MKLREGRKAASRWRLSVAFVVVAVGVSLAAVASACTVKYGQTYYSDDTTSKSIAYGGTVTAHAHGAIGNADFVLVTGVHGSGDVHSTHPCMDSLVQESGTVRSTSGGEIANTKSSSITRSPGTWQVCFYEVTPGYVGDTATGAALLTIS